MRLIAAVLLLALAACQSTSQTSGGNPEDESPREKCQTLGEPTNCP